MRPGHDPRKRGLNFAAEKLLTGKGHDTDEILAQAERCRYPVSDASFCGLQSRDALPNRFRAKLVYPCTQKAA